MYTVRILNNERTLLGVLPVLSWKYNNRFNEASEFSITVARTLEPDLSLDSEAYTLIEPHLPAVQEDSPATFVQPNVYLSYYLQLYKGSELVAMGQVAKRDFSTNTVSIKAHTEEFELSKYSCPSDYSRCYDGMDICDLARDVTRAWRTSRVKAKSEWDSAVASSGIDTATEPSVVMLAKSGTAYVSSGYITLEFSRPFQWDKWERIRWSGDSEAPVYTTMAYRTYNGSVWTGWTAEIEGAYPAELGVEIADTSAQKVQVRITLSTDDTTSEDDSGNPVGVTPRLFAVEVISRTAPMLTVSGDASSGVLLEGVEANEKSALQILQDAFELYGWEFYVLDGTLHIAEAFGSELGRLFRNGTNIDIHQLSDGLGDVYNVLKAKGQGSGINRPMVELSDAESILEYGVIEHVGEYDTSDITELTSLATADLNEHKDAKPTWKLNTLFPYGEEPDFGIGDIVKVADPNTGIVSTTRIEQEIRSYSGGKLDIECYLGVVRLDLVPRRNPQYRDTVPIERPITVRAIGGFKSIIVSVTKPLRLWETTEVYVSTTSGFTPGAGTLVSSQRSTQFELTNLMAGTRYYIKARHVKTDGEYSSFSDEASAVPTMAQAEDLDIRIGFGIADNSPSAGKVRIHGIDASGQPTNDNGWIRSGVGTLVVPYTDVTLIDDKQNFLILSGGVVIPCWFDPNTNRMKNSAGTQVTTGHVIGYVIVSNGSVTDSEAYDNAISISQQINNQSAFILGMLAEAGEAGFADVAEAMGISNAFTSLASYNAFIVNLFAQDIVVGGQIRANYTTEGDIINPENAGFWLSAKSGILRAQFAELVGTLRTGLNAPTDARVAIQDETGITSGPTFTGSGLNDLTITKAGDVAGDFRVKISGINNGTDSGKEGYWATPFQVGNYNWNGVAVNSSGRFVAVGNSGYVSYSNDGITWATPFTVGDYYWYAIAVNSSGRFVAVGEYGYISYSDDGITWATPFQVGTYSWYAIAVNSSGRFVAVGRDGYISYSDDGITWATPFQVGTYRWNGVAVNSSGRFVAVGLDSYISYSDDGITWATPFQVGTYNLYGIAVNSSGRFVAVGRDGDVSYSDDGINWVTPFTLGISYWYGIAVNSSGRFVAVGRDGYISYSDDGITWATPFQVGTYRWNGVAVNSSGRFVAVGNSGYIAMSLLQDTIQISSNGGTTWGSDIPIPANEAISITGFGIDILFGHFEGHTVGDYWSFKQGAMRGLAITDSGGSEYFSASNGVVGIKNLHYASITGSLTTTQSTNTVTMTDLVPALGLEVGDVIQIAGGKLHTVESITNNNTIVVNYEHCGNRGNGSLKVDAFSSSTREVRLVSKWWQAPFGLGQAWVSIASSSTKTNTTNRTIAIHVRTSLKYPGMSAIVDGTQMVKKDSANANNTHDQNDWVFVPAGSTYSGHIIREFR